MIRILNFARIGHPSFRYQFLQFHSLPMWSKGHTQAEKSAGVRPSTVPIINIHIRCTSKTHFFAPRVTETTFLWISQVVEMCRNL